MVYITGDIHGQLKRIKYFCRNFEPTKQDVLVILGDAGFNYYGEQYDFWMKEKASHLPITILCIHGNHEERPYLIPSYKEEEWRGGTVYVEDRFPNLLFAKDGSVFEFEDGKRVLVAGGAHSIPCCSERLFRVDKPTEEIRRNVEKALEKNRWKVDYVFSHTCPISVMPQECFIPGVPRSGINVETERWLETIAERLNFKRWFCGHFHTEKTEFPYRFLFNDIILL